VPQGYYNAEVMLRNVARRGGEIGVCSTCSELARRDQLGALADRTLVF
jgi:hypothetical protein